MKEIPHIIHYCWFGRGEKPDEIKNYIEGWKKKLPHYEFLEWNEDNFNVETAPEYVREAYSVRKFAFVSDYARIQALAAQGGVYLDTDIEILRNFDEEIKGAELVLGFESDRSIETAFIAAAPENEYIKGFLETYNDRKFINADGTYDMTPINDKFSAYLAENAGLDLNDESFRTMDNGKIKIYPRSSFAAFDIGNWHISPTEDTYTIHHMNASWSSKKKKLYFGVIKALQKILGIKGYDRLKGVYDKARKKNG